MPVKKLVLAPLVALLSVSCGDPGEREAAPSGDAAPAAGREGAVPRHAPFRTDTLMIEGTPEPMRLALFRSPDGFPLPFRAYVPEDMSAEIEDGDESDAEGAAVRFIAEFGGQRNPGAFVHLFVFPPGTDRNRAIAQARAYEASRGVPVSRGLDPLAESGMDADMPWALWAFPFRYQSRGQWYGGAIGVGEKDGRFYQIVRHFPAEYGDGFGPRVELISRTWRWADGTALVPAPEARADPPSPR